MRLTSCGGAGLEGLLQSRIGDLFSAGLETVLAIPRIFKKVVQHGKDFLAAF